MPISLFIDTNIFLSFYHLSGEDLEELKKLAVLLQRKEICLFLPEQVVQEFHRNRDSKIADAIKKLREQKLDVQFPRLCKDYPEYLKLRDLLREYEHTHAELLSQIATDVEAENLRADKIIAGLFSAGECISTTSDLVASARLRMHLGNPPGKDHSLGDALNWEALLQHAPELETLHFVTDDRDYASPLETSSFNAFLRAEWQSRKRASIMYYTRLSGFFKREFPQIRLASEIETDLLINKLATSSSFKTTHGVVAQLRRYSEFSAAQVDAVLSAVVNNSQVSWIATDDDIRSFLTNIIANYGTRIDPVLVTMVQ